MKFDYLIGKGFNRWTEGQYTIGQQMAMSDFKNTSILLSGSYRSGKTEGIARIGLRHACFVPNAKVGVFRAHLASLKKSTLITFLELVHPSWVEDWSNTSLTLRLVNNSVISFIGADFPDRLGSIELTQAIIDEAAELSRESRGMIEGRLSGQVDLPENLLELPENIQQYLIETQEIRQTFLACNPKSDGHPLYHDYINEKTKRAGHISYISNSISNPNLPVSYLKKNLSAYVRPGIAEEQIDEEIRKIRSGEMPSDGLHLQAILTPFGQRNLLALWVAMEGGIYTLDENELIVDSAPTNWSKTGSYYAACDFGFHNPRIIICEEYERLDRNGENYNCYLAIDFWHNTSSTPDDLIDQLVKYDEQLDLNYIYLPPDQPGIIKTAQSTLGASKIKRAKNDVKPGINICSRFFSRNRFKIKKNPKDSHRLCWSELDGYAWATDKDGNPLEEPLKERDHYPDAIRYLLYTRHYREESILIESNEIVPQTTIYSIGA